MDRDMFSMKTDSINNYTKGMLVKYGPFYATFVSSFLNNGGIMDSTYAAGLKRFLTDRDMRDAYDSAQKKYPDISFLQNGITDAFKHIRYYFPQMPLPKVVTVMSGYNFAVIYYDSTLAISLEMFLGTHCSYYDMLGFPKYKTRCMSKDYILCDAVYGWLESIYNPPELQNDEFLKHIIKEGKVMYLLDAALPEVSDTIKIRYTERQLKWCRQNEFYMWAYIIQQKLLFSSNISDIAKFIDDGPFTPQFNHDFCPSRTGNWLGWQIVRSYMKRNPATTLQKLMSDNNADNLLRNSGYKPEK
jgi:hypothetical protein